MKDDDLDGSTVKEVETVKQRISQDTGYMSTKRSLDQSPYSMKYIACNSDSKCVSSLMMLFNPFPVGSESDKPLSSVV